MLDKLAGYIKKYRLLSTDQPVLVGVSGGLDSMGTLFALRKLGYDVICAHFDHQLRAESSEDGVFVRQAAEKLGIKYKQGTGAVNSYHIEAGLSLEEAGRNMRYRFLFATAHEVGAQAVVTGHTSDDQVETVLMHFLRGAGLSGMKGMSPAAVLPSFDPFLPLVRPLLNTSREELEVFCSEQGITYREDPTNADPAFFRNRIRHELIPELKTYNKNISEVISRNAKVLGQDHEALSSVVQSLKPSILLAENDRYIQLDRKKMIEVHVGLQARLLRAGIKQLDPSLRDIDLAAIERGLGALEDGGSQRSVDLVGGLKLLVENDMAWIAAGWEVLPFDSWPQLFTVEQQVFVYPGEFELAGGWYISGELLRKGSAVAEDDNCTAFIDADRLSVALTVRGREAGDRFLPFGLGGHSVKVSDFMVNEKLPKRVRARWPLIVSGDNIVWVAGKRLSEHFTPTSETAKLLILRLLRR